MRTWKIVYERKSKNTVTLQADMDMRLESSSAQRTLCRDFFSIIPSRWGAELEKNMYVYIRIYTYIYIYLYICICM